MIKVIYQGRSQEIKASSTMTVHEVLRKLEINAETVLVRRNKEIVPDTDPVSSGDTLEVLRIVSGG